MSDYWITFKKEFEIEADSEEEAQQEAEKLQQVYGLGYCEIDIHEQQR